MGCSRKMEYNALKHMEAFVTTKKHPRAPRSRKTTDREDSLIVRSAKEALFKSSNQIKHDMELNHGICVSSKTIRRHLNEKKLRGSISQKKPFVSDKKIKRRLSPAKEHIGKPLIFWKNVLWSDDSNFCRWGSDGKRHVWRPVN